MNSYRFKIFISVKMTDMKYILALSFKCTCAVDATSNESVLIHFVWGKLCSHKNLMLVWNFISVKMADMKSIPFWFHFASIHVNTSKELTQHRSEIFNRNEIFYWFEFILLLMWTYSYFLFKGQAYISIPDIMIKTSGLHHWVNIGYFSAKFEIFFVCWD